MNTQATNGAVTFIDCEFGDVITGVTLRENHARIRINGIAAQSSGSVNSITIDGVEIMSGSVAYITTSAQNTQEKRDAENLDLTTIAVVNNINAFTSVPDYIVTKINSSDIEIKGYGSSDINFLFPTIVTSTTILTNNSENILADKLLYTYPYKFCPSYVDNATALAALGEGYYYKDTTSGKFEVTIA